MFTGATLLNAQSQASATILKSSSDIQAKIQSLKMVERSESETTAGFDSVPPWMTSIRFINLLDEDKSIYNQVLLNGSGVAIGDVDGDGLPDIYLCGLDAPNKLYKNLGSWRFVEMTKSSNIACANQDSTSAVLADFNGDGSLDLAVGGLRNGVRLFLNVDGLGVFEEVTESSGLKGKSGAASLAVADVNGDGWLDLYLTNYRNDTIRDMPNLQFTVDLVDGKQTLRSFNDKSAQDPDVAGRFTFDAKSGLLENGEPDVLYINQGNGKGKFKAISWGVDNFLDISGTPIPAPYDWGLSAMFQDWTGDGAPDLYVCNDFQSPDRIWVNDGAGIFREISPEAVRQTSLFSMGVDFSDVNGDGLLDFFVADMLSPNHERRQTQVMGPGAFAQYRESMGTRPQSPRNTLLVQRPDGGFSELARFAGIEASEWSWRPMFLDVDLDGYEDLIITTGHWRDAQNADIAAEIEAQTLTTSKSSRAQLQLRKQFPKLDTPNQAFRNLGNLRFKNMAQDWGLDERGVAQGMARGDLDGDGDQDLVINNLNSRALLLENKSNQPRILLQLIDQSPNTHAIGAQVRVQAPGLPDQLQEITSGGGYLSSDDTSLTFALGENFDTANSSAKVEIRWRDGVVSTIPNLPPNHRITITRVENESSKSPATTAAEIFSKKTPENNPLFSNANDSLKHRHVDQSETDFDKHTLLQREISDLGPGMAVYDFNQDGWEDLLIGGGTGGTLSAFRNDKQGNFIPQKARMLGQKLDQDQTSILVWQPDSTDIRLLVGYSNPPASPSNLPAVSEWSLITGERKDWSPAGVGCVGPMALGDIDQDGDLDLFVGSRWSAEGYPRPGQSWIFRNQNGVLEPDPSFNKSLDQLGMVTSAVWSDLNQDGWPDLAVACEWGSIQLLYNNQGQLQPTETALNTNNLQEIQDANWLSLTGRWASLVSGDFNHDGRMDLVVGNWGSNSSHAKSPDHPWTLHYPTDRPDAMGGIESYWNTEHQAYLPHQDLISLRKTLPEIAQTYSTFEAYSQATTSELINHLNGDWARLESRIQRSIILINHPNEWEAIPLPEEAQWSPVMGLAVGDVNNDGYQDLAISQNYFGQAPMESRQDAGQGLVLLGTGAEKMDWITLNSKQSGVNLSGSGRATALADFSNSGRLDWVATQRQEITHIYKYKSAPNGLRLKLTGPSNNPDAIGSQARAKYIDATFGPTYEVQTSSGYLTQPSHKIVLGAADKIQSIEVRWPGGELLSYPVDDASGDSVKTMLIKFDH